MGPNESTSRQAVQRHAQRDKMRNDAEGGNSKRVDIHERRESPYAQKECLSAMRDGIERDGVSTTRGQQRCGGAHEATDYDRRNANCWKRRRKAVKRVFGRYIFIYRPCETGPSETVSSTTRGRQRRGGARNAATGRESGNFRGESGGEKRKHPAPNRPRRKVPCTPEGRHER